MSNLESPINLTHKRNPEYPQETPPHTMQTCKCPHGKVRQAVVSQKLTCSPDIYCTINKKKERKKHLDSSNQSIFRASMNFVAEFKSPDLQKNMHISPSYPVSQKLSWNFGFLQSVRPLLTVRISAKPPIQRSSNIQASFWSVKTKLEL